MKDYYQILNVPANASQAQIKKAYFSLVRKYDPERFPEEFMEIREAYEVLSNEQTRSEYDSIMTMDPVIRNVYEYCRKSFEEGDYEEAINGLEEIIKRVPNLSIVQELLGEAYLQNGNTVKAINVFEDLVRKHPDNASFVSSLANAYLERGWHKKALNAFKKAIELDEDNLAIWLGLAEAYYLAKDYDRQRQVLISALEKAREKGWDSVSLYFNIIQNDILTDNMDVFDTHLEELSKLAIEREDIREAIGWAMAELGRVLVQNDMIDVARAVIDKTILIIPNDEGLLEYKRRLDRFGELKKILEAAYDDPKLDRVVVDFIALEIMPDDFMGDTFPHEMAQFFMEYRLLNNINLHMKSILHLKEEYPELYAVKKDFFVAMENPYQRNKMLRRYQREERRYMGVFNLFKSLLDEGQEDLEDDEDYVEPWYSSDKPYVREQPKVGRNDPCPCGSGKKYKKCCGKIE
ncbi:curved DNA-binding protein CbpA [Caldicoprobacter guelmensis]|uniref:tetratricopeptide repeat protein n=1 Tax=Caldicoprobacter guelmensis TaxID=1170224 RepID=UPI00195940C6|nr:tetratricopeptide repeat protein [Caldicoprobacter guelmensis]MBM7583196.1 curved DNA-binding protein CbpA [Caldicoprobacter guelmensis]